jgi:hypothetical protein
MSFTKEQIAVVIHEANRAIQKVMGQPIDPPWEEADWRQKSTLESIEAMERGEVDFEEQHERWLTERTDEGWAYGPVKDADKKTSPLLLSWDNLPEQEKAKNYVRLAIYQVMRQTAPKELSA